MHCLFLLARYPYFWHCTYSLHLFTWILKLWMFRLAFVSTENNQKNLKEVVRIIVYKIAFMWRLKAKNNAQLWSTCEEDKGRNIDENILETRKIRKLGGNHEKSLISVNFNLVEQESESRERWFGWQKQPKSFSVHITVPTTIFTGFKKVNAIS